MAEFYENILFVVTSLHNTRYLIV